MQTARISRCGLVVGALLLAMGQALADARSDQILKRAEAIMKGANSYQGVYTMVMNAGQAGSLTANMDVKARLREGKVAMKMAPVGKPTGQMAMAGALLTMQMVDDGKNMYMYNPMMGGYRKGPHQASTQMVPSNMNFRSNTNVTFAYLSVAPVDGRPADVVKMTSKTGPHNSALLYFDKATGRFRKMDMTQTQPNGMKMAITMVVKSDQINAPIPDSVFHFVPPPGAKEIKGPPMGMGSMVPGMGGPAGARPAAQRGGPPHK